MAYALFLTYLAATFIRPFELMPSLAEFRPMMVLGGVALLAALLSRAAGRSPLSKAPQLLLILLLVMWAAFSILITQKSFTGALDTISALSANLFIFYLLALNLDTVRRLRTVTHVLTALGVLVAGEGISAYHFGYRADELIIYERADAEGGDPTALILETESRDVVPRIRHRGVLADPNDLAQGLVALIPIAFFGRRRAAVAYNGIRVWLPAALLTYAVFLTRSRGGVIAFVALIFLGLRKRLRTGSSLLVTAVGVAVLLSFGVLAGRTIGVDASASGRTDAWRAGWAMLKESPIWGIGYGMFGEHHERTAHNSFVECFAELGLVGYFLWLGTLVVTFWMLRRVDTFQSDSPMAVELGRLAQASAVSLVVFLVAAFFLSRAYQGMLFILLGLATAVTDVARRRHLEAHPPAFGAWVRVVVAVEFASLALLYVVMRLVH